MNSFFEKIKSFLKEKKETWKENKSIQKEFTAYQEKEKRSFLQQIKKNWWYYTGLLIFLTIFIFSVVKIIAYFQEKNASEVIQDNVIQEFIETEEPEDVSEEVTEEKVVEPDTIKVNFEGLLVNYPEVVGYIYCANTGINYPVVKTDNDEFYLTHGIDGKENKNGAIFMEYLNARDFSDFNTLLYGHNMKSGRMFSPLVNYRKQAYYDEHPYMYIYTPYQDYRLDLVAGFTCDGDASYDVYQTLFSDEEIASFINRSDFKSKVENPTGRMVTLSTCSYTGKYENERYVVIGALIPVGEDCIVE